MLSGCVTLAIAGMLCFSGIGVETKIYCSDNPILGVMTCEQWNAAFNAQIEAAKRSGCMSQDGSSSSCTFTMPH
jgi:hypothetical protein